MSPPHSGLGIGHRDTHIISMVIVPPIAVIVKRISIVLDLKNSIRKTRLLVVVKIV